MDAYNRALSSTFKSGKIGLFFVIIFTLLTSVGMKKTDVWSLILLFTTSIVYIYYYTSTVRFIKFDRRFNEDEYKIVFKFNVKLAGYLSFLYAILLIILLLFDIYKGILLLLAENYFGFFMLFFLGVMHFTMAYCIWKYVYNTLGILRLSSKYPPV